MSDLEWVRRDGVGQWEAESGGGGSAVQVVGPFPVTYTELTGLSPASGVVVTSFDEGTIVIDVWCAPVTKWDLLDMSFNLTLYNADYGNFITLYNSSPRLIDNIAADVPADHVIGGNSWDVNANQAFNAGDGLFLPARVRAGGCDLVAIVDSKTGTPTQGRFDVYALLYVPT